MIVSFLHVSSKYIVRVPFILVPDDQPLPPPQPSEVDEGGNLPEKAPGAENKLPEQPAPEPSAPEDLGKVSSTMTDVA